MKLSDYVAAFLARQGVTHVFAISGGACLHLIDSIAKAEGIEYVCPHHEQAGAMAADAYARTTGRLGAAISTSGPGATNMITGICCAFYDSVPVIYITGQVATFRLKRDTGVRQLGFQETDIVEMCRPITKYAVQLTDPSRVRHELEKAVHIATSGRPGPVLIDIPDNLQREDVDVDGMTGFTAPPTVAAESDLRDVARRTLELLRKSSRPILIYGWGIRLARGDAAATAFLERSRLPVVPTWGAVDLVPSHAPNYVGTFGLHGTRYGNFAVQNSDCIVAIGTRLDTHETGTPLSSFGREARKVVVDIDPAELAKFPGFGLTIDLPVEADARRFLEALLRELDGTELPDISAWRERIRQWREQFSICPPANYSRDCVDPYVFVKTLSGVLKADATVAIDTGCAVAWFMQAFESKPGQRVFSALNNTPMGYALPAAIGASFALGGKPVVCLIGDGGLMMNIQELATIMHHRLPVKVIVLNNHGYSMIQQTQDQWLGSRYHASSEVGGLSFPDFVTIAQAHRMAAARVERNAGLAAAIERAVAHPGPFLCDVALDPAERVIPQVTFGRPIEDAGPLLTRDVFLRNMLVKPTDASREGG